MKIATFNINDVNKRLPNLLAWLRQAEPDVVCLQELKATDAAFPQEALLGAGYQAVWRGQRTWNGVAILARDAEPILTRRELPGDPLDPQARYIEAAVRGVLIGCLYLPNGNPQPGPKFEYKMVWFERLLRHAADLLAAKVPVVLAGDFNVVPTDADIYPSKSWARNALVQPRPREAFASLLAQGWTDALRAFHPLARSIRSGTISVNAGSETPDCAWITFCSAPKLLNGWLAPMSTNTCGARLGRAIMRLLG